MKKKDPAGGGIQPGQIQKPGGRKKREGRTSGPASENSNRGRRSVTLGRERVSVLSCAYMMAYD